MFCAKYPTDVAGELNPKITLVWTDRADTTQGGGALVNQLDLTAIYDKTTYYGNGGTVADTKNNVEQILLNLPSASVKTLDLKFEVTAASLVSAQPYALVVTGNVFTGNCSQNPDPIVLDAPTGMFPILLCSLD
jgi:hypothetical protein